MGRGGAYAIRCGEWESMDKKRILYTVCFIAINMLDFVCNTQNGDIQSMAVNAMGIVILVIIATGHSVRDMLTGVNLIWTGLCVAAAVVPTVRAFASGRDSFMGMFVWAFVLAVFNVWWILIYGKYMIGRLWRYRATQGKWAFNPGITGWIWIAMTVLMTLSRSGRVWPVWFFAMFGMFYLTKYSLRDRDDMMDGMIDGTILSFFILQIFAYGFRPYDVVRYIGAFSNCNITALHYLLVYTMVLFKLHLLHRRGARKGWKLFYFAGACGLLGFMFLTMGRTAWVTAFLLTVLYGIFVVRQNWQKKWSAVLGRFMALGLTTILLFPAVFATVRWLPTILHHPVWFLAEYSENKVHSFDPPDSPKYIEWDEFMETVLGRIWGTLPFHVSRMNDPFLLVAQAADSSVLTDSGNASTTQTDTAATENGDAMEILDLKVLDKSLNVRLSIYKMYFQELNLLGHSQGEGHYIVEDTENIVWHAHNLWLQIAYSYGIPTGLLFVVLTVLLLRKHYTSMKAHSENVYAIIPFFLCVMFFCYGIMEMVWNVGQVVLLLFFVVQHPQIGGSGAGDRSCRESKGKSETE